MADPRSTTLPDAAPPMVADQAADRILAARARASADHLAALIAAGMLAHVARPDRLPELLWPHIPAEHVRAVWDAALAVGYHAGRLAGRPAWERRDLDEAHAALAAAAYDTMAALLPTAGAHSAAARGAGHPADHDTDRARP
ncbi:hypothetical protein [Actinacidiphila acididurans]|uniref:Uncharacterized protein n=1 Tax=Actinacidiphila acididurans TaxID=2784346 RepID=A0ABS2U781_9ACTN|nr:hypothetical protein [Actinacidiphila acididurans]MBM9510023.1 hypothetical protein [Actinacidiphila acididurans]